MRVMRSSLRERVRWATTSARGDRSSTSTSLYYRYGVNASIVYTEIEEYLTIECHMCALVPAAIFLLSNEGCC